MSYDSDIRRGSSGSILPSKSEQPVDKTAEKKTGAFGRGVTISTEKATSYIGPSKNKLKDRLLRHKKIRKLEDDIKLEAQDFKSIEDFLSGNTPNITKQKLEQIFNKFINSVPYYINNANPTEYNDQEKFRELPINAAREDSSEQKQFFHLFYLLQSASDHPTRLKNNQKKIIKDVRNKTSKLLTKMVTDICNHQADETSVLHSDNIFYNLRNIAKSIVQITQKCNRIGAELTSDKLYNTVLNRINKSDNPEEVRVLAQIIDNEETDVINGRDISKASKSFLFPFLKSLKKDNISTSFIQVYKDIRSSNNKNGLSLDKKEQQMMQNIKKTTKKFKNNVGDKVDFIKSRLNYINGERNRIDYLQKKATRTKKEDKEIKDKNRIITTQKKEIVKKFKTLPKEYKYFQYLYNMYYKTEEQSTQRVEAHKQAKEIPAKETKAELKERLRILDATKAPARQEFLQDIVNRTQQFNACMRYAIVKWDLKELGTIAGHQKELRLQNNYMGLETSTREASLTIPPEDKEYFTLLKESSLQESNDNDDDDNEDLVARIYEQDSRGSKAGDSTNNSEKAAQGVDTDTASLTVPKDESESQENNSVVQVEQKRNIPERRNSWSGNSIAKIPLLRRKSLYDVDNTNIEKETKQKSEEPTTSQSSSVADPERDKKDKEAVVISKDNSQSSVLKKDFVNKTDQVVAYVVDATVRENLEVAFKTLKLEKVATKDEINKQYKKLLKELNAVKNITQDTKEFQLLISAKQVLDNFLNASKINTKTLAITQSENTEQDSSKTTTASADKKQKSKDSAKKEVKKESKQPKPDAEEDQADSPTTTPASIVTESKHQILDNAGNESLTQGSSNLVSQENAIAESSSNLKEVAASNQDKKGEVSTLAETEDNIAKDDHTSTS